MAAQHIGQADEIDPVRRRREQVRRVVTFANRLGYLLLLVAVVAFFVALATDFTTAMATVVIVALVAACVLLAPTIVLGYAVKAADREDRERGL
jgi:small-conductance mechanosensitive channel